MGLYFAISINEMGLGKLEIFTISFVLVIFPVMFFIASKNLDSKGIFDWMMEKPDDWIGKK
tara:strand:+ start:1366 stop:1548 length:183 start_codon:yes stop_codon:yes gene_type:complete